MYIKEIGIDPDQARNTMDISLRAEVGWEEVVSITSIDPGAQRDAQDVFRDIYVTDALKGSDTVILIGRICIVKGEYWKDPNAHYKIKEAKRIGAVFLTDIDAEEV